MMAPPIANGGVLLDVGAASLDGEPSTTDALSRLHALLAPVAAVEAAGEQPRRQLAAPLDCALSSPPLIFVLRNKWSSRGLARAMQAADALEADCVVLDAANTPARLFSPWVTRVCAGAADSFVAASAIFSTNDTSALVRAAAGRGDWRVVDGNAAAQPPHRLPAPAGAASLAASLGAAGGPRPCIIHITDSSKEFRGVLRAVAAHVRRLPRAAWRAARFPPAPAAPAPAAASSAASPASARAVVDDSPAAERPCAGAVAVDILSALGSALGRRPDVRSMDDATLEKSIEGLLRARDLGVAGMTDASATPGAALLDPLSPFTRAAGKGGHPRPAAASASPARRRNAARAGRRAHGALAGGDGGEADEGVTEGVAAFRELLGMLRGEEGGAQATGLDALGGAAGGAENADFARVLAMLEQQEGQLPDGDLAGGLGQALQGLGGAPPKPKAAAAGTAHPAGARLKVRAASRDSRRSAREAEASRPPRDAELVAGGEDGGGLAPLISRAAPGAGAAGSRRVRGRRGGASSPRGALPSSKAGSAGMF